MELREKHLLAKAVRGDTAAFGEIVQKYQYLVYSVALQISRDPIAAQDVAQETFLSAFIALKDLRSEESFGPWLRKITRNKALSWRTRQQRLAPLEQAGELHSPPAPSGMERDAERKEANAFQAAIRQMVSSLSDVVRIPILLCYVDDLPTAEAARFLGIKEGTLRKRLHDGKKKLQEKIVKMAEGSFQECRLPRDFAKRCICGCRRSQRKASHGNTQKGGEADG